MELLAKNKNEKAKDNSSSNTQKDKDIIVEHKKAVDLEGKKRTANIKETANDKKDLSINEKLMKVKDRLMELFNSKKSSWEAPKIIKTNLIKGEITSYFDWKNSIFALIKNLFIAFIFFGVIFVGLRVWEIDINKRGGDIKDEVAELSSITSEKEKRIEEIRLFHQKVTVAGMLLDKHIYWTSFFKFLEDNILEDVYLTGGFSGNAGGTYTFSALAKDFNVLAAQSVILNNLEEVKSVEISGGTATVTGDKETGMIQSGINFNFTIDLGQDIFKKN